MQGLFTIQQLINKNKIILNALLIHLPKISPSNPIHKPIQKLKDQRGISVDLRHSDNINIVSLDVEEGC